jgi:hypothetical protein
MLLPYYDVMDKASSEMPRIQVVNGSSAAEMFVHYVQPKVTELGLLPLVPQARRA